MKAMMIDTTLCVGCRGCQVACKEWNNLPAEKTSFFQGDGYQNPGHLSAKTWTIITYNDVQSEKGYDWVFGKLQCFHCLQPACADICPVKALTKTDAGPVIYDKNVCLGCRYCQLACPFNVPGFEWEKAIPEIKKCSMCAGRIQAGQAPACAKSCPTEAIIFGEREKLIIEARRRIAEHPDQYIDHIYGEKEVGGTCVLHISGTPFEKLDGFPQNLPQTALAQRSNGLSEAVPFIMTGLGIALGGVSWVVNRKNKNQREEGDKS